MIDKEELGLEISKYRHGSEVAWAEDLRLAEYLLELGYRKVRNGKPPVLSNREMAKAYGGYDFQTSDMREVCKTQRNADVRFYNE